MNNILILLLGLVLIGVGIKLFLFKPNTNKKSNRLFDQIAGGFKNEKEDGKTSLFDQITTGNFENDEENK